MARNSAAALWRSTKRARAKSARAHLVATGATPIFAGKEIDHAAGPERFRGRLPIKHHEFRKGYRGGRNNYVRSSRHNVSRGARERTSRARAHFRKNAQTLYSPHDW